MSPLSEMEIDTNVSLRILGEDVEPETITLDMGMPPDQSHRKGDVHGARRPVVRRHGYWSITSSKHIAASDNANDHIRWLVAAVAPKIDQLSIYKSRGWTVDVWIGIHTSAGHGGPTLRPEVLAQLAGLGMEVNLDLYPDA